MNCWLGISLETIWLADMVFLECRVVTENVNLLMTLKICTFHIKIYISGFSQKVITGGSPGMAFSHRNTELELSGNFCLWSEPAVFNSPQCLFALLHSLALPAWHLKATGTVSPYVAWLVFRILCYWRKVWNNSGFCCLVSCDLYFNALPGWN